MVEKQKQLDTLIRAEWRDTDTYVTISEERAFEILNVIKETMRFQFRKFEWDAMQALIKYYSEHDARASGDVLLLAETGRRINRRKSGDKSGRSILGQALRKRVESEERDHPALILLEQEGSKEQEWSGHSFWWPILVAPTSAEPCVFATKTSN